MTEPRRKRCKIKKMSPTTSTSADVVAVNGTEEASGIVSRMTSFLSSLTTHSEAASATRSKILTYLNVCQKEIQSREVASHFPATILATMAEFAEDRKTYDLIANCGRRDVQETCQLQPILQWYDSIKFDPKYMKENDCYDVHLSTDLQLLFCIKKRTNTSIHYRMDGPLPLSVRDQHIAIDVWNARDGDDLGVTEDVGIYSGLVYSPACKKVACWMRNHNGTIADGLLWNIYIRDVERLADNRSIRVHGNNVLRREQLLCGRVRDAKFLSENLLFVWHHANYGNNGFAIFALWDVEKRVLLNNLDETAVKVPPNFNQQLLLATSQYILWESLENKLVIWEHGAGESSAEPPNNQIKDLEISTVTAIPRPQDSLQIDKLIENPCNPNLVAVCATVASWIENEQSHLPIEIALGVLTLSRSAHDDQGPIDRGRLGLTFQDELLSFEPIDLNFDPDLGVRRSIFQWFPCGEYAFYGDPGLMHGVLILRLVEEETASGSTHSLERVGLKDMPVYQKRFRDKVTAEFALERKGQGRISRIKLSADGKAFLITSTTGRVKIVHV